MKSKDNITQNKTTKMTIENQEEIETNAKARTRAARRRAKQHSAQKLAAEFGPKELPEPTERSDPKPFVPKEFDMEIIDGI